MAIPDKDKAKYRETLLVIVLGFSVLYLLLDRAWLLYISLGVGILGMLSARLNRWIHLAWFFAGDKLGFVVSKLLLGAVYLVVLVPVGLLSRVFRRDTLNLRPHSKSGFHRRDKRYGPGDLENMW